MCFHFAERSPSATAAGEPSSDEAKKQRISGSRRKQKGRRLLAAGSGLGDVFVTILSLPKSPNKTQRTHRRSCFDTPTLVGELLSRSELVLLTHVCPPVG